LARSSLPIGLKDEEDKIDFDKREGPLKSALFLLQDPAITLEIGMKYHERADLDA
jgi:hypothetical protein